jgi:hypothetical protein
MFSHSGIVAHNGITGGEYFVQHSTDQKINDWNLPDDSHVSFGSDIEDTD